jgi:hypothetical protein
MRIGTQAEKNRQSRRSDVREFVHPPHFPVAMDPTMELFLDMTPTEKS